MYGKAPHGIVTVQFTSIVYQNILRYWYWYWYRTQYHKYATKYVPYRTIISNPFFGKDPIESDSFGYLRLCINSTYVRARKFTEQNFKFHHSSLFLSLKQQRRMKFRPCIDLHAGSVKQIVGSTLSDKSQKNEDSSLTTNFESEQPASYFADMYRRDGLTGGHVIMLGSGNTEAVSIIF